MTFDPYSTFANHGPSVGSPLPEHPWHQAETGPPRDDVAARAVGDEVFLSDVFDFRFDRVMESGTGDATPGMSGAGIGSELNGYVDFIF